GVAGETVPPGNKPGDPAKKPTIEKMKNKLFAAAETPPGGRDGKVAPPQRINTAGELRVVRAPVIAASGQNDTLAQAQQITLPAVICGAIEKNEDVDFFKFHVEEGTSLSFQVRCARLEDRIHDLQTHADPILTLRNAAGGTLASSDNNSYYADPVFAYH